jgi:hypothetical protein
MPPGPVCSLRDLPCLSCRARPPCSPRFQRGEELRGRQALDAGPQFPAAARSLTEPNACAIIELGAYEALPGIPYLPAARPAGIDQEKNLLSKQVPVHHWETLCKHLRLRSEGATSFPPGPSSRHTWSGRLCYNSPNAAIPSGGLRLQAMLPAW